MKNLRPTKSRMILFLIMFFFLFFYVPVIKCVDRHDVKKDFCTAYKLCTVDIYYSLYRILANGGCDSQRIWSGLIVLVCIMLLMLSYLLACVIDCAYQKYRNR